jgi:hypothetical protein
MGYRMKLMEMVVAALALAAVPQGAIAQVLRGRVIDHASGAVLSGAQMDVIDERGSQIARTATDTEGRFELRAPRSGAYRLRASLIGYETFTSDPLDLGVRETVELLLYLSVEPVPLTPVIVRTRSDRSRLTEFERRKAQGLGGYFITRQDIERRPIATASELLSACREWYWCRKYSRAFGRTDIPLHSVTA